MENINSIYKRAGKVLEDAICAIGDNEYVMPSKELYPAAWGWDTPMIAMGLYLFNRDKALKVLQSYLEYQWPNGMIPHIVFPQDELFAKNKDAAYFPPPHIWYYSSNKIIDYSSLSFEDISQHAAFKISKGRTTAISQYPVWAICVEKMHQHHPIDKAVLKELLYKIDKSHEFFNKERDPLNLGIAAEFHPWIGCDNAPCYDIPMSNVYKRATAGGAELIKSQRVDVKKAIALGNDPAIRPSDKDYAAFIYIAHSISRYWQKRLSGQSVSIGDLIFAVYSPMLNAILNRADQALLKLAGAVNEKDLEEKVSARLKSRHQAMVDNLWDPADKVFKYFDAITGKKYSTEFIGSYFPLIDSLVEGDIKKHLLSEIESKFIKDYNYPLPTTSKQNVKTVDGKEGYSPMCYWRGPKWFCMDALLLEWIAPEQAENIKCLSLELVCREGFREYFNPETGKGYGADNFGWTAAFAALWISQNCN